MSRVKKPTVAETEHLFIEWDHAQNLDVADPSVLTTGSTKKVHWVCSRKHKWEASVSSRYKGAKCPYCSGRRPIAGETDLGTLNPDLASQWAEGNDKLPNQVTRASGYLALWNCPKGHTYRASVSNRSKGKGCPFCSGQKVQTGFNDLQTMFPKVAEQWSKSNLMNPTEVSGRSGYSAKWVCLAGHEFTSTVSDRTRRDGPVECAVCSGKSVTHQDFLAKSHKVWGSRWDYSQSTYVASKSKMSIGCKVHGEFLQTPNAHYAGNIGCTHCQPIGTSSTELDLLQFVSSLGVEVRHRVTGLISSHPRIEADLYCPDLRVAIEYNGLYYHSEKFRASDYHKEKCNLFAGEKIKLVQVWEDDWRDRDSIIKEHIRQVLGKSKLLKISARKTTVKEVDGPKAKDFLRSYHIQGSVGATHRLGLYFEDNLVALACFKGRASKDFELVRYATSANVQGGHSKLVSYFERNYSYRSLVTFADLTFGDGNLYQKTGWVEDRVLRPDYSYLVGNTRQHKFNYRLKRFREDPELKYTRGMTERELSQLNGLLRIYDAGKIRFVKPHPSS